MSAQIQAPQLRCISVTSGGDVVLNWISPSDPNTTFTAYEIYHSPTINGTFSLMTGTITPITTNAYTLTAGPMGYYYIRIKEGSNYTTHSDTIRTIFLNILAQSGAPDIKLVYNDNHKPRLSSSATSYTIIKEFPPGTFNPLAVTPLNQFPDTIAVCSASISYYVMLRDQSGCISYSNKQGGLYSDQKQPNKPFIDSISVLPNGQIVIGWQRPSDIDVKEYEIQIGTSLQGGIPLDTVNQAGTTLFTYTNTVATQSAIVLGPKAIDSCGNGSEVDYTARTMFLSYSYDKCGYATTLSWTPYSLRPANINAYDIYYSVDGGSFKKIGSTTLTTFYHSAADPSRQLSYFVRMVSKNNGPTSSSNRINFLANQVESASFIYISSAGFTSGNELKLQIVTDTSHQSAGAEVLRSEDGMNFQSVGFMPISKSQRTYTFSNQASQGFVGPYYFKLIIRDSCNNARAVSNVVKTILLKVENDLSQIFTKHLSWTAYEGFSNGIKNYYVYRIVNGEFNGTPLAILKPTDLSYSDNVEYEATAGASIVYQVVAMETPFNVLNVKGQSASNEVRVYTEGTVFVPNAFAPMGNNRTWKPITHFVNTDDYKVKVYDQWGHIVFQASDDQTSWDGANCEAGVYAYQVVYLNARGEYTEVRGSVMLLR